MNTHKLEEHRRSLAAAVDVVIPPDAAAGGWSGGVERLVEAQGEGFLADLLAAALEAVGQLDDESLAKHGMVFADLDGELRLELFARVRAREPLPQPGSPFDAPNHAPFDALITLAFQGYYGGIDEPAGWQVAGFAAVPIGVTPHEPAPLPTIDFAEVQDDYDVIVIGAGGGGGVAAAILAEGGLRVLLVERARLHSNAELRGNHLQGKREQLYSPIAGAGVGHPRVLEHSDGTTEVLPGEGGGMQWGLNALAVGGGTRLWQGMSWRFFDEDFAMASTYGVPDTSTLIDWPFGYDELAPYYDQVEWQLGVSGDGDGAYARRTRRTRDFPMPPLPDDRSREAFGAAARSLNWAPTAIPFAINSVAREGRPACVQCPQCVGNACPVDAKNGTQNTFVPRALRTGKCDLLVSAQATRIHHDGKGQATSVELMTMGADGVQARTVRAGRVVLAAGAIESPRLLLNSDLGNSWVGRNHHTHGVAIAIAAQGPDVNPYVGPGHSVAVVDYLHAGGADWGGGVLFDAMPAFPLAKANIGRQASGHEYGIEHKRWMRESPNAIGAMSMVQEIPHELSRVSIDPEVRDVFGMPVARLRGEAHPATLAATTFMAKRCEEWVTAAGGQGVFSLHIPGGVRGAEHSAGTIRMGNDPTTSGCDARGRLHGTANVYVADACLNPTNGGVNPGLTVLANAMRVATLMLSE